jgi:phosphoglycerate dehydrogenase-like enzyme
MTDSGRRALVYEKMRPGLAMVDAFRRHGVEAELPFGPESCLRRTARLSPSEIIELASGFSAIVGASCAQLSREVLEALPELLVISKLGIGHDVIDLDAATQLGIAVTNTPSLVEIESVAEHAVALLLACAKRLDFYDPRRMARGGWQDAAVTGVSLRGKTLGLLGFGRIARQVAERMRVWGMEILVTDQPEVDVNAPDYVRIVDLPELLAESDLLSVHAAMDHRRPAILGPRELASMKPGSILVNTSRGANIDQAALARALSSGHILAAGLDVFAQEPPDAEDPLLSLPNVILTPHLGAVTPESEADMERMAVENAVAVLEGRPTPYLLNPTVMRAGRPRRAVS